jgi:nitroreductase
MVVVVAIEPVAGSIPTIEQVSAAAAATQNILLAATALGLGSMWRTGDPCYDPKVRAASASPRLR